MEHILKKISKYNWRALLKKSNNKRKYLWIIFVIVLVCLGFFVHNIIVINKNVVAVVNGEKITLQQIKEEIANYPSFYGQFIKQNPKLALDDYIDQQIVLQKAKRFYWTHKIKINKEVENYKDQLIIKEFLDNELASKTKIPADEIKNYYNLHLNDFFLPERAHLYEIVVPTKAKAIDVLKRLSLGENFSDIAKKESTSSTAENGGDMGFVTKSQLYPNFANFVFQLHKGQIFNKIIKTTSGYHIIKMGEVYPPQTQTLKQATPLIKEIISNQEKKQLLADYIDQLKKNAKIKIYSQKLKNL